MAARLLEVTQGTTRPAAVPVDVSFEARVLDALAALASATQRIESEVAAVRAAQRPGRADPPPASADGATAETPFAVVEVAAAGSVALFSASSAVCLSPTVPLGWPAVLRRRDDLDDLGRSKSLLHVLSSPGCVAAQSSAKSGGGGRKSNVPVSPTSRCHTAYAALCLLVLCCEFAVLPFVLAWDMTMLGWLQIFTVGTPCFWTLDIMVNFCTGIYRRGDLIMDWKAVARAYCSTWFLPDLAVVLCDWMSLAIGLNSSSVKMLRLAKLGRLVRIVSMVRVARVLRIVMEIFETQLSDVSRLYFQVLAYLVFILWGAHLLSCLWFFVGTQSRVSDTGASWLDGATVDVQGAPVGILDASTFDQYSVCLHWAVSQITLGATDVMPSNTLERLVFACTTVMGFLFGSMLVSFLSAGMVDVQMSSKDKVGKLRTLRQYLREIGATQQLSARITKQIQQRLSVQARLEEQDVPALGLLSHALLVQLRFQAARPCLQCHPLFRLWINLDNACMQRVCFEAVAARIVRAKDELFDPGQTGAAAFVATHGKLSYVVESFVASVGPTEVASGHWMSEAALWVEWTHVGRLEAVEESQVLVVSAKQLPATMTHVAIRLTALEYAVQFHKRIVSARPPLADYPTDLCVPHTDYDDIVASMTQATQQTIALQAFDTYTASQHSLWTTAVARHKLEAEILSGRSLLVVTGEGSVRRVVSLVVLRLMNSEGALFVQLGDFKGSGVVPTCQLPGIERRASETYDEPLQRLLASGLDELLEDKVDLQGSHQEISEIQSRTMGVDTKYLRTVYSATMKAGAVIDAPSVPCGSGGVVSHSCSAAASPASGFFVDFSDRAVWAVRQHVDSWGLYAWLLPNEFAFLAGGAQGEQELMQWLSLLTPPNEAPPKATDSALGFP